MNKIDKREVVEYYPFVRYKNGRDGRGNLHAVDYEEALFKASHHVATNNDISFIIVHNFPKLYGYDLE